MFQKLKQLTCLILVILLTITNTDTLMASDTQTASLTDDAKWEYTIPANPADGVTITGYKGAEAHVVIPGTLDGYPVRTIDEYAFVQRDTITSITIPKEVTEIGYMTFDNTETLEELVVEPGNEKYFSRDGILYCKEEDTLYYKDALKLFRCPRAKKMKTVTIPDDVELIGSYAFHCCTGIEDVVIGNHVSRIYHGAFYNSRMKTLTLGSGIKHIEVQAFEYCKQLETVSISGEMSYEWTGNPFHNCTGLKEISLAGNSAVYTLKDGVLFGNGGKRLLTYPPMKADETYTVPDPVEEIANFAFHSSKLKQVKLPHSLQSIGMDAFGGSYRLQSVTGADQLCSIASGAFSACYSLETIELPDTLEIVGSQAFGSCRSLSGSFVFPTCLKLFGDRVFYECEKVTEVTFLAKDFYINNDLTSIPNHIVIKGYKDSAAETYAKNCGKIFVDIETGKRTDYSYTTQTLLDLLPEDLEYGEPVSGIFQNCVAHEYDVSNEKYVKLKEFTDNLVKDCTTDCDRMFEILIWVRDHITYEFGCLPGAGISSVYHTFYSEDPHGNCEVFAQLTAYMLYLEGIPNVLFSGNGHEWCGAYSRDENQWYMVDSTHSWIDKCDGPIASRKDYESPIVSFSSGGMVFSIYNNSGIELVSINYGNWTTAMEVTIPDFVTSIGSGALDYYGMPEKFLIHGTVGTYAETYVKEKGWECIRYHGNNTFTACRSHREKELRDEDAGTYQVICERCGKELSGKFLNQPEITSLTASDAGVTVVWNKVAHAEKYRIYRRWHEGREWKLAGEADGSSFLDYDLNVASLGGAYYYTVQAVAEGVESPYHSAFDDSAPYVVCKPGKCAFHGAYMEENGIHLYWASASNRWYTGVEIYRSVNGGPYEKVSPSIEDVIWDWLDETADKTKCNTYYIRAYNKVKDTIQYGENSAPINVADLAHASIELDQSSFTYNGRAQTPSVTVKHGNVLLEEGTDYTVSAWDNKNAGTARLTVGGKEFVSGNKTAPYTIGKAKASLTAKADSTSIRANGRTMVRPSGFWDGDYSFTSSDDSIATVTDYGLVTGVSAGEVTITVTSEDTNNCASGSASVTITVTVTPGACIHNYEYTKTTSADCTAAETGIYICTKCQDSYTASQGKPLGHDYQSTEIPLTCTTSGYTHYKCSRCNDEYRRNYIPAYGHVYGKGVETKAPSCEEPGEITYRCQNCTEERTQKSAAAGHKYNEGYDVKPATCQTTGVREYHCLKCGSTYTEASPKRNHAFSRKAVYPDCTTNGYSYDVCYVCGIEKNHVYDIKAYGHSFSGSNSVVTKEATCTQLGEAEQACSRCGETRREVVPMADHDYQEETIKEVTCTEAGKKVYTCSVCETTTAKIIEPLGHAYEGALRQPTCTEEGAAIHTCKHCGDSYQYSALPAIGHDFEFNRIIQQAACGKDGTFIEQCSHCGMEQTKIEPAWAHDYTEERAEIKATCASEGVMACVCRKCGGTKRRTVPKLDHKYRCLVLDEPTATEPGRRIYLCDMCGDYYYETFGEKETGDGSDKTPVGNNPTENNPVSKTPIKNTIKASNITKVTKSGKQTFTLKATQTGNGKLSFSSNHPAVTITKSGKVTIKKNFVGKVAITITAAATKDYQAATKKITLRVNPAPVQITKAAGQKQKLVVKWKKNAKAASYQIQYATSKNFKSGIKTAKIKKNTTVSYKSPKLKKGKTYYIRMRTYKNGCYSAWSKVKTVTIRK